MIKKNLLSLVICISITNSAFAVGLTGMYGEQLYNPNGNIGLQPAPQVQQMQQRQFAQPQQTQYKQPQYNQYPQQNSYVHPQYPSNQAQYNQQRPYYGQQQYPQASQQNPYAQTPYPNTYQNNYKRESKSNAASQGDSTQQYATVNMIMDVFNAFGKK